MGCRTSSKARNNVALRLICQSTLKEFIYKLFPSSNGSSMTGLWRWALDLQSRPPISTSDLDLQSWCLMRARIVMIWLKKGFLIRYSLLGLTRQTPSSVIIFSARESLRKATWNPDQNFFRWIFLTRFNSECIETCQNQINISTSNIDQARMRWSPRQSSNFPKDAQ